MTTYLYNYEYLYPVDAPQEDVEKMTLECHSVEPTHRNLIGGSQWSFKVVGRGDQLFRTSYHWALVEDTQENRELIKQFEALHKQRAVLQKKASAVFNQIKTIK